MGTRALFTSEISDSVSVVVLVALDIDLVDGSLLPPLLGRRPVTLGCQDDDHDGGHQHAHPGQPK